MTQLNLLIEEKRVVIIQTDGKKIYQVNLPDSLDLEQVFDRIFQVSAQKWCTPQIISELSKILADTWLKSQLPPIE